MEAHDIDVYVGAKIKSLRIAMGVTQQQLGGELGITFQQMQKYENGKNRVSAGKLWQIAVALGVTPGHFFPAPNENARSPAETASANVRTSRMIGRIKDPTTRKALDGLISALAKA